MNEEAGNRGDAVPDRIVTVTEVMPVGWDPALIGPTLENKPLSHKKQERPLNLTWRAIERESLFLLYND